MDFLGLKTLSILKTALELIKQNHDIDIDLDNLSLEDEATYKLYQNGETNGTFQFESTGMQKYLRELKPDAFADLIANERLVSPRADGIYSAVCCPASTAGKKLHTTCLKCVSISKKRMALRMVPGTGDAAFARKLAGFSKGDADVLRKAMGKKQKYILDKMKAQFIKGATEKGHKKDILEKIWTDWEAFAQYAFNKSHSTCYAYVAYQTAWLKTHYPGEYMSAVLNHAGSIEKMTFFNGGMQAHEPSRARSRHQ